MWLSGFALIPLQLIAIFSSLLGFPFVLIAWIDVTSAQVKNANGRIPTALYAFTVSVLLDMMGVVCGFTIAHDLPDDRPGMWLKGCVFPLVLVAALIFLIISMVLLHRDSWREKKDLQLGSKALFIIAVLGFIWFSIG
jgi:ABC-type Na+ efflux pump permease subunit